MSGRRPACVLHAKPGDAVRGRASRCSTLHTDDPARFARAVEALAGAIEVAPAAPAPRPLVLDRIAES